MSDTDNPAPDAQTPVATDKAELQEPSETGEQTNEAPEATQAVEEKQAEEVKAADKAEEQLLAGTFKSPEDLEKAYKELRSKFTQETSEKAELTRILNEAFAAEQPSQETQTDDFIEPDPQTERLDRIERQSAVQNFIFAHPDANAQAMNEILTSDPSVKAIGSHEAKLEYAYYKSQNMASTKTIAEVKKATQSETQAKIVEKQAAQVESARKAEDARETTLLDKVTSRTSTQAESDEARRELIRKNLVNL